MILSVIAFVAVLGILIFVHELGHFLLAKRFGVGVEKFSLGFGPKLFGKKYGETEYQISAIPLGGYVKMVGEDPKEPLPPEDLKRSFNQQSVWKRFWIVFAGPSFNILFAIFLFWGMFMIGYPTEDTTIGWVETNSPAWDAGIRSGDHILSIDGEKIRLWEDLSERIKNSRNEPIIIEVQRQEEIFQVTVQPQLKDGKNLFGEHEISSDIGIQHHSLAAVVGISDTRSPAGRSGFMTGDQILSLNGKDAVSLPLLEQMLQENLGSEILFEVQREDEKVELVVNLDDSEIQSLKENQENVLESFGLASSELFVRQLVADSPAEEAGLLAGDRITAADGKPVYSFSGLQEIVSDKAGVSVALDIIRDGQPVSLTVVPEEYETKDAIGNKIKVGKIGIYSSYYPIPGQSISVRYNPITALYKGFELSWEFTSLIMVSLFKMVQKPELAESLGGPILIAQLAGQQVQYGILELIKFMALISINLGILNLLPIPILDGGHILFFAIEGFRGRPLSMKKREMAQQVGLLLLLSLILFVTYNDIMRIFG